MLLAESVKTTLFPAKTTLFVVSGELVIVNSVRCPFSAARTTFSFDSVVSVPFITNVGLLVAEAPLSISIPLFSLVPLIPKCTFFTSRLPPLTRTPPYLNPEIETLSKIILAPS